MITLQKGRSWSLTGAAIVAIVFGGLTIVSGGQVLFGDESIRQAAGNVVPFILWFNFTAGFAYVVAGVGLLAGKSQATWLASALLLTTIAVFVAFGLHIAEGGVFESRTVGAMTLRTAVWLAITWIATRKIGWR